MKLNGLIFLALAAIVPSAYAANFTVNANLGSLDLVVNKSSDDQIHITKNFDEAYFRYREITNGNTISLVSEAEIGINVGLGKITYHKNMQDQVIRKERAQVIVQVPDGASVMFVSTNGRLTVNDADCTLLDVKTINGSINYTGGIEEKNFNFQTINGNITIALNGGSDVNVDIQKAPSSWEIHFGADFSGIEKTGGNKQGSITNKRGSGTINVATQKGTIKYGRKII